MVHLMNIEEFKQISALVQYWWRLKFIAVENSVLLKNGPVCYTFSAEY